LLSEGILDAARAQGEALLGEHARFAMKVIRIKAAHLREDIKEARKNGPRASARNSTR
jgi:hypothetical protein